MRCTRHDARSKRCRQTIFYCRHGTERCLEEAKIAPQCSLFHNDRTWCYVNTTQHHQPATPGAEMIWTESSSTHEYVNGIVSALEGGSADGAVNFQGGGAKTAAGSYMRVAMGDLLVWALKLDPILHQDTIVESQHLGLSSCVIKTKWLQCEIIIYSFWKFKM